MSIIISRNFGEALRGGGFEEGAHHKILQGGTASFSYATEHVFIRKGLHKKQSLVS